MSHRRRAREPRPAGPSAAPPPDLARRFELWIFLALVAFTYLSMSRGLEDGNTWARMGTVFGVVERGTFDIDPFVKANQTHDWSRYGGHYFSNKAPGPALLAVPFYFAQYQVQSLLGVPADSATARSVATYVANAATSIVPTLVALALLWTVLVRRWLVPETTAFALCGTLAVGSLMLPYSVLYFGHQSAAAFFGIGMGLSLLELDRPEGPRRSRIAMAGIAMGLAVIADYLSASLVAIWTLFLIWRDRRTLVPLIAGGAGPAIVAMIYDHACFGSALTLPYNTAVLNPLFGRNGNWDAPSLDRLLDVTVRPYRGLFYCTPVFALIFVTFDRLREESKRHPEILASAAGVLAYLLLHSCYKWAFAGWCLGPRFFTSAMPLLILLVVPAALLLPRLFGALAALSAFLMLAGTLVDPIVDEGLKDPYQQFIFPALSGGGPVKMHNIFTTLLGFDVRLAILAYAAVWIGGGVWLRRRLARSPEIPAAGSPEAA